MAVTSLNGLSRHHLIPIVEFGTDDPINIVHVPISKHNAWNKIFGAKLPEDCLQVIVNFLGWDAEDCLEYRKAGATVRFVLPKHAAHIVGPLADAWLIVFPSPCPVDILESWLNTWVPQGYFEEVRLCYQNKVYDFDVGCQPNLYPAPIPTPDLLDYLHLVEPIYAPSLPRPHKYRRLGHRLRPADRIPPWYYRIHLRPEALNGQPLVLC